jgi:hypothetical protein
MLIPILYSLVFLVFFSEGSCEAGYPAGFTRTASFRNWIRDETVCRLYENKLQLTVIKNIIKLGCRELYLYFHFFSRNCFI